MFHAYIDICILCKHPACGKADILRFTTKKIRADFWVSDRFFDVFCTEPHHQLSSSSPWLQICVLPGAQRECGMAAFLLIAVA